MTASVAKELYNSPNGDRWTLSRDDSGRMVVIHQPNRASGGRASEVAVEMFLAENHQGPEHEALVRELKSLGVADADKSPLELSAEQTDRASRALGQAVARCWSRISQEISMICSRPPLCHRSILIW